MIHSPKVLWRLSGETLRDVECVVASTPAKKLVLTVNRANDTMLNEAYPDLQSATARADQLRTRLVKHGWCLTPDADREITRYREALLDAGNEEQLVSHHRSSRTR